MPLSNWTVWATHLPSTQAVYVLLFLAYSWEGELLFEYGNLGGSAPPIINPRGLICDNYGKLLVCDALSNSVRFQTISKGTQLWENQKCFYSQLVKYCMIIIIFFYLLIKCFTLFPPIYVLPIYFYVFYLNHLSLRFYFSFCTTIHW